MLINIKYEVIKQYNEFSQISKGTQQTGKWIYQTSIGTMKKLENSVIKLKYEFIEMTYGLYLPNWNMNSSNKKWFNQTSN